PGDEQEIVFGIVWSQGGNQFSSVQLMKQDDAKAQTAFDLDFNVPPPPNPPRVSTTEVDEGVILSWSYNQNDNNYLNSYDAPSINLIVPDPADDTYTFEGYVVYQFDSAADQEGEIIAVYDQAGNNVTNVTEGVLDPATGAVNTVLLVPGTDNGVSSSHFVQNLTNYTNYFFGVQAYAYNEFSNPQWFPSPITRVTVMPTQLAASRGGTVLNADPGTALTSNRTAGGGGGSAFDAAGIQGVRAEIFDPSQVTGDTYAIDIVEVGEESEEEPHKTASLVKTFSLRNVTTGETLYDAAAEYERSGLSAPLSSAAFAADGVSFTVTGPEPGALVVDGSFMFVEQEGPDDSYACGPNAGSTFGCAQVGGNFLYPSFNGAGNYIMYHEGDGSEFTLPNFAPQDYEIRFTEAGSYGYHPFTTGNAIWVPFEVWDIGPTYTGTAVNPNDPADDVQMIPNFFVGGRSTECEWFYDPAVPGAFGVFSGSTMRVYAYYATNGYAAWEAAVKPLVDADPNGCPNAYDLTSGAIEDEIAFGTGRPIQRMVFFGDDAQDPPYPHPGVVVRFYTTKPLLVGDTYEISTEGFGVEVGSTVTRDEALDKMTIVPNPYLGSSDYEVARVVDIARLTNLPERATIRIFTLNGTLIRVLEKNNEARHLDWDMNTEEGLPIASGMYLIHIEAKDDSGATYGERVLKFAAVKKRVQLNEL
ncbi:MAG: T9SS type A sorting domain-containing protein, partial [Rhodothermales bacterium]|nr:T9SS type A sorting domain-containing protein [Rhodothermales bacterium]